uniref:Uncharacterized protein n=1 Tax=Aegilops tauschii subsp. strangulata TaxID=200361 RepID=A0A453D9T6_AEGTS
MVAKNGRTEWSMAIIRSGRSMPNPASIFLSWTELKHLNFYRFLYEHKYILSYIISFIILVHNFMSSLVRNYFDLAATALLFDILITRTPRKCII